MKVYSITCQTILSALKRQWRRILVFVLAFALLGAAAGLLFRSRGIAEAGGGAQHLAHRAASGGEFVAVMVVFCVLTGLCLGVFLAVCREAEAAREEDLQADGKRRESRR